MISPGVFVSFSKVWFFGLLGGKRAKNSPKWELTITSVMDHISGTVYLQIIIFCALMSNDSISKCFFHFFKNFILWVVRELKVQKMVQNDKTFCPLHSISEEPGPFRRFSTHVWQNACANTVMRAMVCDVYFPFSKIL